MRNTKRKIALVLLVSGFLLILSLYASMTWRASENFPPKTATLMCTIFQENEPLANVNITLEISSPDGERITISGKSESNGSICARMPTVLGTPALLEKAVLSDAWMIRTVIGDRAYHLSEGKWSLTDPQAFLKGDSDYTFSQVYLQQSRTDEHTYFSLKLHVLTARLIAVHNSPAQLGAVLPSAQYSFPGIGEYLSFELVDRNFVAVEGSALVAVPIDQPLKMAVLAKVFDFNWHLEIEVDVGDRDAVDLSAPTVRATSSAQTQQLSLALQTLEAVGFGVEEQYEIVGKIRTGYEEAALAMELGDYSRGFELIQSAWAAYTEVYFFIREVFSNVLPWTVSLTLILAFFSITLAYLLSERESTRRLLMPAVFLFFLAVFLYTQPYLRLFVVAFTSVVEKLDVHLLVSFVQMLPWIMLGVMLSAYPRFRDLLWETFGVTMRNMRRRRLRTLLTFCTIVVVSASAMCVLSITHHVPLNWIPVSGTEPTVPGGLVVSRYEILTPRPVGGEKAAKADSYPLAIPPHEAAWIMSRQGVVQRNVYGLKHVKISDSLGQSLSDFSTFYIAVVKPSFVKEFCAPASSMSSWLDDDGGNTVLLGSKIAWAYGFQEGDEMLIDDHAFIVKGVFDENQIVEEWKEIDGQNFFYGIYNPLRRGLVEQSFLIGSVDDFELGTFDIYRISLVLGDTQTPNELVESILQRGYTHGVTPLYEVTRTYFVHAVSQGAVTSAYYGPGRLALAGPLQAQMVVMTLSALMVFLNVFASVSERKSDIVAMYVAGASPLRIRLVFMAEAITLGSMGGIYGYIVGFTFVRLANLISPGVILLNLSGSAPFLISVSASILPSVLGSISPSRKAMLSIVPSRRTLQKGADVIFTKDKKVFIDIPIRVHENEFGSFGEFLNGFAKRFPPVRYGYDGLSVLHIKKKEGKRDLTYMVELNYAVERSLYYKITILLTKDKEAREIHVGVLPLDPWQRKVTQWSREHAGLLPRLATCLRSELLRYVEWRGEDNAAQKAIAWN